jgi:hypothetical protein
MIGIAALLALLIIGFVIYHAGYEEGLRSPLARRLNSDSEANFLRATDEPEVARLGPWKSLQTFDRDYELRVPVSWHEREFDRDEDVSLKVSSRLGDLWVKVVRIPKDPGQPAMLPTVAQKRVERWLMRLEEGEVVEGPKERIIGGQPAIWHEIHGNLPETGAELVYLVATVDGARAFHHIAALGPPVRVEKGQVLLKEIIDSFRAVSNEVPRDRVGKPVGNP